MSSNNANHVPLSKRFAAAYPISRDAGPSDPSDLVKRARKALRGMQTEFKKKEKDVRDVCEAARVVGIPQQEHVCAVAMRVRHDHSLLKKELERLKRS